MGELNKLELSIGGMHCTSCAAGVEARLRKLGSHSVEVDFATGLATIEYQAPLTPAEIVKAIESSGYHVQQSDQPPTSLKSLLHSLEGKLLFSLLATIPLISAMFLPWPILRSSYLQLALCLPVYSMGVFYFGRSAISSLRNRVPNMDVLITLGISSAFFYSLYGTVLGLGHDFLFYETAASIISLVLLGNLLEKYSIKKTTSAIEELSRLQPETAKLILDESNGVKVREVNAVDIKVGDRLIVNTGDKVPVDGVIYWGNASLNESIISGESMPVEKVVNKQVISGSIVEQGSIKIIAEAVGNATTISQIIKLVSDARSRKPMIQKLGDRVSSVFVPIVLSIAIATVAISFFFFDIPFSRALINAVAVLVIACPCAMGLATPTAIMVGLGRAAKAGILIKGGNTVEQFATIEKVVFDKTGTLTTGQFELKEIHSRKYDDEKIKSILLALEQHSSHPIARSLTSELVSLTPYQLKSVKERNGVISGHDHSGNIYKLGSFSIAKDITSNDSHDLYLIKNDTLIAMIDIQDGIKPNARQVIDTLKMMKIEPIMLSGDKEAVCASVARELGIQNYQSRMLPEEKLRFLDQLQSFSKIAFVGDGVNDAPALTKATVGVSLSTANQVAIDSAQIILLDGNLGHLLSSLLISRLTLRTIKQNLFWAFFYNVCAIPFAAFGFLNPMVAAGAMAASDILVIGNSLWLKVKRLPMVK